MTRYPRLEAVGLVCLMLVGLVALWTVWPGATFILSFISLVALLLFFWLVGSKSKDHPSE